MFEQYDQNNCRGDDADEEGTRLKQYDLHVHTNWSDGSTPVETIVKLAARRGLAGLAISDHDSMGMVERAKACAKPLGMRIVSAVELSCFDPDTGRKVHLLVYAPRYPECLTPHFETMAYRRRQAGKEMVELVCAQYPVEAERILQLASQSETIYRVHILRALLELGYSNSIYGPLYQELFGKPNGTCLRSVAYPSVYEMAKVARQSCGAVVLAHPGVYNSFAVAKELAAKGLIDGIEYRYPRKQENDAALHDQLVNEYGLLTTGGTDFHGWYTTLPRPVGSCFTTEEELERILSRAKEYELTGKEDQTHEA